MACVPWVMAPPARNAAATRTASAISRSEVPSCRALFEWISMQYGHCVVNATASDSPYGHFTLECQSLPDIQRGPWCSPSPLDCEQTIALRAPGADAHSRRCQGMQTPDWLV